jgi:hypothetical protein
MGINITPCEKERTQADEVLYFIQILDLQLVDLLLDSNRTYQGYKKLSFINRLGLAFDEFEASGDTFLTKVPGQCSAEECNYKCKGFSFIGNNSGNYFDLIIDVQEGYVQDIYECSLFQCVDQEIQKNERIKIDRSNFLEAYS